MNSSNIYRTAYNLNSLNSKSSLRQRDQYRLDSRLLQLNWTPYVMQSLTLRCFSISYFLANLRPVQEGILPTLVTRLTVHAALAQDTSDAEVIHEALSYLLQCRNAYSSVVSLVSAGKLPEAVKESANVQQLLDSLPESLRQTAVIDDLKVGSDWLSNGFVYQRLLPFSKSSVPPVPALRTSSATPAQGVLSLRRQCLLYGPSFKACPLL